MASATLAHSLLTRADTHPDGVAFELVDPAGSLETLTYAQLAARASALARELVGLGEGPVLLAYPAGPSYAVAVFASFLAGRPVIPAFPPTQSSLDRHRLHGIVADARPGVVLAPEVDPSLAVPVTLAVPDGTSDDAPAVAPRQGSEVGVIQYTSGSTGRPRGVLVRHDSLVANTAAIIDRFELGPGSRAMTWLPPFHDMGLVGGLLTPVHAGIPMRIMPPEHFVKSPLTWLRQISDSGTTASGGPDFAYELCTRRVRSSDQLDGLDLSRWKVAFSGGERVRLHTLTEFARTFAPAGFRPESFLPCYGLAEATLIVSAGHWDGGADGPHDTVSCGRPVAGQDVAVVAPETRQPVGEGEEGEIWVRGPHVTQGYLTGEPGTLFGRRAGRTYLRTGDLGRVRDGELLITGRLKDVIVVRGVNHHAADVETAALEACGSRARTAAAFLVDDGPRPLPVLVLEVGGRVEPTQGAQVAAVVLSATGLRLERVVLVRPRSIPRTSSGKVRRAACRDAYLAGAYAEAVGAGAPPAQAAPRPPAGATAGRAGDRLTDLVAEITAGVCGIDDFPAGATFSDLGVDSVRGAEIGAVLEAALAAPVPMEGLIGARTPRDVAEDLVEHWAGRGIGPDTVLARIDALAATEVGVS